MTRQQWQTRLGGAGERVSGLDELAQSLLMLLANPLGSVPGRPLYGSNLHELIDAPIDEVRARAPGMVMRACMQNLPRLKVLDTRVSESLARVEIEVEWHPAGDEESIQQTRSVLQ